MRSSPLNPGNGYFDDDDAPVRVTVLPSSKARVGPKTRDEKWEMMHRAAYLYSLGVKSKDIAAQIGIGVDTLRAWGRTDEFQAHVDMVRPLVADTLARAAQGVIAQALGSGDAQTARWLLPRIMPDTYAMPSERVATAAPDDEEIVHEFGIARRADDDT